MGKINIEEMQKIAEERGGKCLSDIYVNNRTKLLWECANKHQWETMPSNIKKGSWCPDCAGNVKCTIEGMHEIAEERGGKCLSGTYVNALTPLLWECSEGHQWEAKPNSIKNGTWCRKCYNRRRGLPKRLNIEEMRKIAKQRGGKCLSKTYINSHSKLLWECAEGHKWEAKPNVIKNGRWCPDCSSGLGERICRVFFEQIFSKKFPRSYPRWLVSKKGNQMELDGFCQSLALAFEHHGEHHYSTKGKFIKSKKELRKRQEADRLKRKLSKQQGIILIEIPEIPNRLSIAEIKAFIRKECNANNVLLPSDYDAKKINLKNAYATSGARASLEEMRGIAKKRGGKCLSEFYVNSRTKLSWECAKKHRWKATPDSIKSGSWCKKCSYNFRGISRRLTIEMMQEIAKQRGGKCLSDIYVNNHTSLLWKCVKGHQWKAKPIHIRGGSWCHKCAGNIKRTIEEMQSIAEKRGGKCLSDTYVNVHTNLTWECAKGHQWKAMPNHIKGGSWCPNCAGLIKLTIKEMQSIAEERGGKCLSETYVNNRTKLLWECEEGHQWEATPGSIKCGKWCRECANRARR